MKRQSIKQASTLLTIALFGGSAFASTADQQLLDILLKNGSINKEQYQAMTGKEGMASSQLLEILSKNGTITKDQYTSLTTKDPKLTPAPAPVATLKVPTSTPDGTHFTFGKNGGLELSSYVKEKDKDGNEVDAPKRGADGRIINSDGDPIVDEAGKPILGKDGKPLKPAYTKEFSWKFGGRLQVDSQVNWNDDRTPYGSALANGVGIRRARLFTEGILFRDYLYRFEYDFARNNGGTQGVTDAYLQYIRIPRWAITLGQQNEGKGLESYMSNNYLTFVERSLPSNAFIEAGPNSKYQIGATAETWQEIWGMPYYFRGGITTESLGAPGPGNSSDNSQGGANASGGNNPSGTNINRNAFSGDISYQLVGRAGFDPFFEKGHHVLHTGVWGSWRDVNNNYNADGTVRTGGWAYQTAPDTNVDRTNWANTGDLTRVVCSGTVNSAGVCSTGKFNKLYEVNNIAMFGAELAGAYGPVHFTAEYMQAQIAGKGYTGSDTLQGFYTQVGWFITGENRPWDVGKGYRKNVWDRVIPKQNFMDGDGWGAFEVAARYDLIDMNTLHINGGSLDIGTLGFNWYFNPRVSLMTNWVHVFATNTGSALKAAGGCRFPAQGQNANIGCFNGLSPDVWETRVRMDF